MNSVKWPRMISINGKIYKFVTANSTQATYFSDPDFIVLNHSQAYLAGTEYLQGQEAAEFIEKGYCEKCLRPAKEWVGMNKYGGVIVAGDYDRDGNLVGFLCPDCGFVGVRI